MTDNNQEKPKIISDEDWKTKAQQEKKKLNEKASEQPQQGPAEMPPANFMLLVSSIAMQVLYCLGAIAGPDGQKPEKNLDLAKYHIDMLGMIDEKTRGNLTKEEADSLAVTLHEIRMHYVQMAGQA